MTALRVGIVVGSRDIPAWQLALIRSVVGLDRAEVSLSVVPAKDRGAGRRQLPYRAFRRIEARRNPGSPDALALMSIETLGAAVTQVDAHDSSAREFDVLVALTECGPDACGTRQARLGVWRYAGDDGPFMPADGSMAGFAETLRRAPAFGTQLRVSHARGGPDRVAYETTSVVQPRSHDLTCNEHLWKCSTFVARALRACLAMGPDAWLESLPDASGGAGASAGTGSWLALAGYVAWRARQSLQHRLFSERWMLMWSPSDSAPGHEAFQPIRPPAGRFWADPHVVAHEGAEHVYFEDASCETGKGHIALVTRSEDGRFTDALPVVCRPYHLSYPFVFAWRGEYFMIPESAENRTIELYRCVGFPDRWEFVYNLIEGISAFDATLLEHDGRWWMFANVAERAGASSWDELCIFHADEPTSRRWRPHAANPVISDVRRARPAGAFFRSGDDLIRPSQDSSGHYGRALNLNRVEELSEDAYRETLLRTIAPDPARGVTAIHSYSRAGAVTFIDAVRRERR